jgi:hypothetical protein
VHLDIARDFLDIVARADQRWHNDQCARSTGKPSLYS